jgi:ATP-dependent DNA ligase
MSEFPPLQKKELSGKTRVWEIIIDSPSPNKAKVYTRSGFLGGKIRQTKPSVFKPSKQNTARDNAKTYAKVKWTAKKRQGYRTQRERFINKTVATTSNNRKKKQVSKFVQPMHALLLEGNEHRLKFPLYAQAKLDGFRGMARRNPKTKKIEITSQRGLPFAHLKVIKKQLDSFPLLKKTGVYLDGEIYLHHKSIYDIKRILGRKFINSPEIANLEAEIRFVIFDWFDERNIAMPFKKRWQELQKAYKAWKVPMKDRRVQLDLTEIIKNQKDLEKKRDWYLKNDYEGIVVRHFEGPYRPGKRSPHVFRSKEFKKSVFKIKGAIEGRGDNKGTVVWIMECLNDKKKTFLARPMGTREERKEWYKNKKRYIGQYLEVKYMALDPKTGCVSRFPVGMRFVPKP